MKFLQVLVLFFASLVTIKSLDAQVSRTLTRGAPGPNRTAEYNGDLKLVGYGWPEAAMMAPTDSLPFCSRVDELKIGDVEDMRGCQFTVVQVLDQENVLLSLGDAMYWITGTSTESLSDGKKVRLSSPVTLEGKKDYQTVGGSQKIVKQFKLLSIQEYNEKRATELTLNTGEKIKLIYKEAAKKGHTFEQLDGSTVNYTTDEFDESSQKIIKKMIDQVRKAAKAKKK